MQLAAPATAAIFLLVGVAGFVPGITSNYSDLAFAGPDSMAMLLGLFMVSVLHNIVHLLFGVAGLVLARAPRSARSFLIVGGVIYLVLWIFGLERLTDDIPVHCTVNAVQRGCQCATVRPQ